MKKTLALLIAVMMIASLFTLTGCAKKEDLDYIKGKGNLVIGFTYFAPMNYDDDNGEFVGFETEFAKAVCAKLGIEPKFQEINWETKETELNARNIDCIWNGMSITDERLQTMGISTPYMENKQILVALVFYLHHHLRSRVNSLLYLLADKLRIGFGIGYAH